MSVYYSHFAMSLNGYQKAYTENIFDLSIPVVALDIVIFTLYQDELCLVLQERSREPEKGKYILPGGILKTGMSLEQNFDDILERKTGITGVYKEQLYTFGDPGRDVRGHIVSIAYFALVPQEKLLRTADLTRVKLVPFRLVDTLDFAFGHEEIVVYAKKRLEWKLEYTNIAANILPPRFSLSRLQWVYETILGHALDKRNFRKKVLSLNVLTETEELDRTSNRPAKCYEFAEKNLHIVEIL